MNQFHGKSDEFKQPVTSVHKTSSKSKRRYCRVHACTRIVKSQGLCQGHGAKPRRCKIMDCTKQAQGNYDGMCKAHFKTNYQSAAMMCQEVVSSSTTSAPIDLASMCLTSLKSLNFGSVYDDMLPASIAWTSSPTTSTSDTQQMPLIQHLFAGYQQGKPRGWHRNEERIARGIFPTFDLNASLDNWEAELAWMETLVLTGNSDTDFSLFSHAWGCPNGFESQLAELFCGNDILFCHHDTDDDVQYYQNKRYEGGEKFEHDTMVSSSRNQQNVHNNNSVSTTTSANTTTTTTTTTTNAQISQIIQQQEQIRKLLNQQAQQSNYPSGCQVVPPQPDNFCTPKQLESTDMGAFEPTPIDEAKMVLRQQPIVPLKHDNQKSSYELKEETDYTTNNMTNAARHRKNNSTNEMFQYFNSGNWSVGEMDDEDVNYSSSFDEAWE